MPLIKPGASPPKAWGLGAAGWFFVVFVGLFFVGFCWFLLVFFFFFWGGGGSGFFAWFDPKTHGFDSKTSGFELLFCMVLILEHRLFWACRSQKCSQKLWSHAVW